MGLKIKTPKNPSGFQQIFAPQKSYAEFPRLKNFQKVLNIKVARCSFSGSIPPKFEHKLRRHKQSLGKIASTVVLDKDENLL